MYPKMNVRKIAAKNARRNQMHSKKSDQMAIFSQCSRVRNVNWSPSPTPKMREPRLLGIVGVYPDRRTHDAGR